METKVFFNTFVGEVELTARMEYDVDMQKILSDDIEQRIRACEVVVYVPILSGIFPKEYLVSLSILVHSDIDFLIKQNDREDARHQVNLDSLKIDGVYIDGHYVRVRWLFTDCYGTQRVFRGHVGSMHKSSHTRYSDEEVGIVSTEEMQVYF